jgi:hypothetical protein
VAAVPRSFDFSIESPVSVEQIHSAFSEKDYWLARLAAVGGIGGLDSFCRRHRISSRTNTAFRRSPVSRFLIAGRSFAPCWQPEMLNWVLM